MSIPNNITAEHLRQAIARIDQEGIPADAHASTYDLVYDDNAYPPKLVLSWANLYANGEELDRSSFNGGKDTPCFQLLEREGFTIKTKDKQLPDFTAYQREDYVESVFGTPDFELWSLYCANGFMNKKAEAVYTYNLMCAVAGKTREQARDQLNVSTLAIYLKNKPIYTSQVCNRETKTIKNLFNYAEDDYVGFLYRRPITWKTKKPFKNVKLALDTEWANRVAKRLGVTINKVKAYLDEHSAIGKEDEMFDIYPTIEMFLMQAKTSDLKTKDYIKFAYDLDVRVSFGMGTTARVPWMSFLYSGQKTSEGIYPGYLLFKEEGVLLLTYGSSEENVPAINWPEMNRPTVKGYLKDNYSTEPARYAKTKVFAAYELDGLPDREQINQDLKSLVEEYKAIFDGMVMASSPEPEKESAMIKQPLNQILYGPPGTGKTYHTIDAALKIIDPNYYTQNVADRSALKKRFEELKKEGFIGFTTFHQSFAYEDFVEGLKAEAEDGNVNYVVEPGIFRRFCIEDSMIAEVSSTDAVDISNKTLWKMSLGNTLKDNDFIYDHCIEEGEIRHGAGGNFDLAGCSTRHAVRQCFEDSGVNVTEKRGSISLAHMFKNEMKVGDLVIITDGNLKFRAIGEITGEYEWLPDEDLLSYSQTRKVKWHRVYEESLPYDKIMNRKFSQASIYKLSHKALNTSRLQVLLGHIKEESINGTSVRGTNSNKVLIIDEINRGNISSIFGELITLIEPSKRRGASEALSAILPYSKEELTVPDNLYLVGTMNTADRSLALMDTALRRRFDFIEMMPDPGLLSGVVVNGIDVQKMLDVMNQRIEALYDREHMLGHAFFMPLLDCPVDQRFSMLESIFSEKILPLLEEYFFEDWEKIRLVLGDNQKDDQHQFIRENNRFSPEKLFGSDDAYRVIDEEAVIYHRYVGQLTPQSYIAIYNA